VTSWTEKIICI